MQVCCHMQRQIMIMILSGLCYFSRAFKISLPPYCNTIISFSFVLSSRIDIEYGFRAVVGISPKNLSQFQNLHAIYIIFLRVNSYVFQLLGATTFLDNGWLLVEALFLLNILLCRLLLFTLFFFFFFKETG
ncbi:hypothetical protein OIU76_016024 [Salix suchowensis]|nr:hypothetical protein OIU76_016024 [Salix suchowensis]